MVKTALVSLLNVYKKKILNHAELAMDEYRFNVFKRLLLDELGERGLEKELKSLLLQKQHGMDGNGRE